MLSLRISSLALPGFGWGGKGNNVRAGPCSPFPSPCAQEGLEAARGARSHAISCRPLFCHFGREGAPQGLLGRWVAFLNFQHQQSHPESLKLCQAAPAGLYEGCF